MRFPLHNCPGVPINYHPGAFGFQRKGYWHIGVDLYTNNREPVRAIENGVVVSKGLFTGPEVNSPWWETTHYLMILGKTGVFNYGEICETRWSPGDTVKENDVIGFVKRVLFPYKARPDIPQHSTSMLHLELYEPYITIAVDWKSPEKPKGLIDPTSILLKLFAEQNYYNIGGLCDSIKRFERN